MATVGLRDLYRAPITVDAEGNESYGTPVRMAKAITAEMSVEIAEAFLYADDGVDVVERDFVKGELKLNINDLEPIDQAAILGQEMDDNGAVVSSENDDPPYYAIGFRARKPFGKYKYIWLYKVKFAVPNEKYATKGDKLEFNTPEITGTFVKRPDGKWKIDIVALPSEPVAEKWYSKVYETFTAPITPPDPEGP